MYKVKINEKEAVVGEINQYVYGCKYQPKVYFKLWYYQKEGFFLKMVCEESNPKAIYSNHGDPVYKDSCMEFFVDFFPEDPTKGYLNFEMNAAGAMLLCYGVDRNNRESVVEKLRIKQQVSISKESWEINLKIPLYFIKEIYGRNNFAEGSVIKGNAYKCGDDTETAHYGTWRRVETKTPDFHRPEFFGEMIIA